jgi:hypothetical protein
VWPLLWPVKIFLGTEITWFQLGFLGQYSLVTLEQTDVNDTEADENRKASIGVFKFCALWLVCSLLVAWYWFQTAAITPYHQPILPGLILFCAFVGLFLSIVLIAIYWTISGIRAIRTNRSLRGPELTKALKYWAAALVVWIPLAIFGPSYLGNHRKFLALFLMYQMKMVQDAAEGYAKDHDHTYPSTVDSFKNYFPTKTAPMNYFAGKEMWPVIGEVKEVERVRKGVPGPLAPGALEYSPIKDEFGMVTGYAIRAGWKDGNALSRDWWEVPARTTLVLSNDSH